MTGIPSAPSLTCCFLGACENPLFFHQPTNGKNWDIYGWNRRLRFFPSIKTCVSSLSTSKRSSYVETSWNQPENHWGVLYINTTWQGCRRCWKLKYQGFHKMWVPPVIIQFHIFSPHHLFSYHCSPKSSIFHRMFIHFHRIFRQTIHFPRDFPLQTIHFGLPPMTMDPPRRLLRRQLGQVGQRQSSGRHGGTRGTRGTRAEGDEEKGHLGWVWWWFGEK